MSDEGLNRLIEEAAVEEAAEAEAERIGAGTENAGGEDFVINDGDQDEMPPIDPMLAMLFAKVSSVFFNVMAGAWKVTPPPDEKHLGIGQAAGQVMAFYNPGKINPKWLAWGALAFIVGDTVMPMMDERAKTIDAEVEPAEENLGEADAEQA